MVKGNLLIGQSGGPTSVINSSLAGAIIKAKRSFKIDKIYCLKNGIEGIFKNEIYDFTKESNKELRKLKKTPGAEIGSCRYKISNEKELEIIKDFFIIHQIKYFLYIGGNDSMDTCDKIHQYIKKQGLDINVIGIPKTIDNDLVETDHTPGFLSAAKYIITLTEEIRKDLEVYDKESVTIIEVMGRHAGWLAASTSVANYSPDLIYLPEANFNINSFINDTKEVVKVKKHCLIVVSEGINLKTTEEIKIDAFGHKSLGGLSKYLKEILDKSFTFKTKAIELHVAQRCASHINSKRDVKEAYKAGAKACKEVINNSGFMVSFIRKGNKTLYKLTELNKVANKEKKIPLEWINKNNNYVNNKFINYLKPLLEKELVNYYPKLKKQLLK